MREMSKDELAQVAGGLKSPRGVRKELDDGDIKLHPVPYRRDSSPPQIPTDPNLLSLNTKPADDDCRVDRPHVDTVNHHRTPGTDTWRHKPVWSHANIVGQSGD
jgi:bacteriocin-like protein